MEMDFIREFLASPNLPDIIAYALGIVILIYQIFAKLGIKKDNFFTADKISHEVGKLKSLKDSVNEEMAELKKDKELLEHERQVWEQEKQELKTEIEDIKKSIRLMSKYSNDLVKTGVSRKINRMLPVEQEEENVDISNKEEENDNE